MKFFAALFLILTTISLPARAAELSASDRAAIGVAESWINSIKTFKAEFLQTTSNGGVAQGEILILRPGRMLIDYAPPAQLEVFADGHWMIYLDRELKEVNQVPLSATPARLLLEKNVRFSEEADVTVKESDRAIRLFLARKGSPEDGRITLLFSKDPVRLRAWTVIDPQGVETSVSLLKAETNQPIDERRLNYSPPDWAFE